MIWKLLLDSVLLKDFLQLYGGNKIRNNERILSFYKTKKFSNHLFLFYFKSFNIPFTINILRLLSFVISIPMFIK